jgi:hypothetical protein
MTDAKDSFRKEPMLAFLISDVPAEEGAEIAS